MEKTFDIQTYLAGGVEKIVSQAVRATLKNPRESAFMARFALASAKATKLRGQSERERLHVPPFLIASITSRCNLHCAGCYSRCNNATEDIEPVAQLSAEDWKRVFDEAEALGVSFILLAGGEPLLRRSVIEAAGEKPGILFPIFTNGTYMDEWYMKLFDRCRNLVPVMSIEGGRGETDARRGAGVYDMLMENMEALRARGLIFGASVTVTTRNLAEVTSGAFLDDLAARGCKAVFFVEYVPVSEDSRELAPGDAERERMKAALDDLRLKRDDMLLVAFPGDEKSSGGCLAAGRGFFHINSHGGAEPCPFSPYSDTNVKDASLAGALRSGLFQRISGEGLLKEDHAGGCVLFERRERVEAILSDK